MTRARLLSRRGRIALLAGLALALGFSVVLGTCQREPPPLAKTAMESVIPKLASATPTSGVFALGERTTISTRLEDPELGAIAEFLAARLRPATGFPFPVTALPAPADVARDAIRLETSERDPTLGEEGYTLTIGRDGARIEAHRAAGVFWGVQTLRQLLPPRVERPTRQPGPWEVEAGEIRDVPRYAWRGAMLDVARSFYGVADLKRYVDRMACYKLNRFHIHLSDDQGWRLEIRSRPELTQVSGRTAVDGGNAGFYSQAEYAEIVAYARSRYVTVVPEIDMPGHTNAALAAYAELSCDGKRREPYTGIKVGFSTLCIGPESTYRFVDDVLGELAALTPGRFIHIGGDEASKTEPADYVAFVRRALASVRAHGKVPIGWSEIAAVEPLGDAIVQHWFPWGEDGARKASAQGARVIMSPASHVYLDMKYTWTTRVGQIWAGRTEVKDAYEWDPATLVKGVGEASVAGVESALWTETLRTPEDLEYMTFPRLQAVAEIAWSPATGRSWLDFRDRLRSHGPRMAAMGSGFYRSAQVPWASDPAPR